MDEETAKAEPLHDSIEPEAAREPVAEGPVLRLLTDMSELTRTEEVQREVWGVDDLEIVPASQMRAAIHAGGHVLAAFEGEALVGFAYALVATPHGAGMSGVGLHSHMVAVLPTHRGRGLGRRLKWFQRRWCLERGMRWISWTFDPLQARNANLNFRHLGVICHDYLVDFYGLMPGTLGGGQPSDRLLALWLLDAANVTRLARHESDADPGRPSNTEPEPESESVQDDYPPAADAAQDTWLLTADDVERYRSAGSGALVDEITLRAREALQNNRVAQAAGQRPPVFRVAAPADATAMLAREPASARLWRLAVRAALTTILGSGMVITAFENGAYRAVARRDLETHT